jgi:hypothetical protein
MSNLVESFVDLTFRSYAGTEQRVDALLCRHGGASTTFSAGTAARSTEESRDVDRSTTMVRSRGPSQWVRGTGGAEDGPRSERATFFVDRNITAAV